jgi:hypothetical protein
VLESEMYEPLKDWLTERGYHVVGDEVSVGDVGRIDVVGMRHIGGDLSSECELVGFEVKRGLSNFAKSLGQAHGYSVAVDRCYLVVCCEESSLTIRHELIAGRLGVGLIRAFQARGKFKFEQVTSAPPGRPMDEYRLQAAEKLNHALCSLCGSVFDRGAWRSEKHGYENAAAAQDAFGTNEAAAEERGLVWWLADHAHVAGRMGPTGTRVRRYLCFDCTYAIAPVRHTDTNSIEST